MLKKLALSLIGFICLFILSVSICFASQVPRVAILPVLFRANANYHKDVEKLIADALVNKFQPPLSKVIPFYDIIPDTEVAAAIYTYPGDKQKSKLEKNMLADAAVKLNADIVIAAEVTSLRSTVITTWNLDRYRETDVGIHVMSYYRPSGDFTERQDRKHYTGDDIEWGRPEYIARQMIADLLNKIPNYRE